MLADLTQDDRVATFSSSPISVSSLSSEIEPTYIAYPSRSGDFHPSGSEHSACSASNRTMSSCSGARNAPAVANSTEFFKFTTGQFAHRQLIFRAEVVQQPERCRMSGFGEKDRRPIDPPPVVKLSIVDPRNGTVVAPDTHIAGVADLREPRGLVYNPSASTSEQPPSQSQLRSDSETGSHPLRNLLGSLTTQARLLRNENGQLGLYFIFSDLAVRTEGRWSCRFSITDINSSESTIGGDKPELVTVFSDPFLVSPAKSFRGMLDSTPLTKAFAKQGVKLILRNVGSANSDDGQSA